MVTFCSLVSGSSGNAAYLEYNGTSVLIDCGVSCKRICDALLAVGKDPADISAILVTHEHSDHIAGISVFSKKFNTPVYATPKTLEEINHKKPVYPSLQHDISAGASFEIGSIGVLAFNIPHDAAQPVGYTFQVGNKKISIATDMGKIDAEIAGLLRGSDFVMLEANHDLEMLKNGPYPYPLKARVLSSLGHLSNEQSSKLAAALARTGTRQMLLGHLSATNNRPELALDFVTDFLSREQCIVGKDVQLSVAPRFVPSPLFTF